MARFWLHGHHLLVGGRKMSKSRGNVLTTDDLLARGYGAAEIRFFLIYGHYRETLSYTEQAMESAAVKLRLLRAQVSEVAKRATRTASPADDRARRFGEIFRNRMDEDMDIRGAFDGISRELGAIKAGQLQPEAAAAVITAIRKIDAVLQVIW
jgi:cysteinyl-tRNA synthetase